MRKTIDGVEKIKMSKDTQKNNSDILKDFKNNSIKPKLLEGLNKLGFPLEFKIRRKLIDRGYTNVQEGHFSVKKNSDEITKSYDLHGHLDKKEIIHNNLTINLSLQIIGDCKYSSDNGRFIFAIPDTSTPGNSMFTGPLLTSLQSAVYGTYRNTELESSFVKKFGPILFASDVKDSSKHHLISGENSEDDTDKKIPEYEKIFNIVENTILPPLREKFLLWLKFAYSDYTREFHYLSKSITVEQFIKDQENHYYSGKLLIPLIVTSKPILKPILKRDGSIKDVEEEKFILYQHSVLKPNEYPEILSQSYDIGIIICNDKYFDECMEYIENIFDKIFFEIINNLKRHPKRLIEDFENIKKQDEELQNKVGKSLLGLPKVKR